VVTVADTAIAVATVVATAADTVASVHAATSTKPYNNNSKSPSRQPGGAFSFVAIHAQL